MCNVYKPHSLFLQRPEDGIRSHGFVELPRNMNLTQEEALLPTEPISPALKLQLFIFCFVLNLKIF